MDNVHRIGASEAIGNLAEPAISTMSVGADDFYVVANEKSDLLSSRSLALRGDGR
jgi:hypothetical protein